MQRRNLIYSIILAILVAAIIATVVLILRKRAMIGLQPAGVKPAEVQLPPGTKLIETYIPAPAWKEGDPIPQMPEVEIMTE